MQSWSRGVAQWWETHDLLVTPTSPELPVRLGELAPTNDDPGVMTRHGTLTTFMIPFDVTGQPAISLPLHWSESGLPVGVQIAVGYAREDVLLRVAAQLEEAAPWAGTTRLRRNRRQLVMIDASAHAATNKPINM